MTETQGELGVGGAVPPSGGSKGLGGGAGSPLGGSGGRTPAKTDLPKWSSLASQAEKLAGIRRVVVQSEVPLAVEGIAAHFKGARRKEVGELVEALGVLGVLEEVEGGWVG